MISLKLEYNKNYVILKKSVSNAYIITNAKDWIYLTKFSTGKLITRHPYGELETIVDRKFVYNQDFEIGKNINFKYRFILPLGNISNKDCYPNGTTQFSGNLNGNGFTLSNINLVDCDNNGLFGCMLSSTIKNLNLENIVISGGIDNGTLAGKATNVNIENVSILGNLLITGKNCSGFIGSLEGSGKNISVCVDGLIDGKIKNSILSNIFYGSLENVSVISNLENEVSCFSVINGKLKNSCFVSFESVELPFYKISKYHQIHNCYYFQLNNKELKPLQDITNCFYKNLDQVKFATLEQDFSTEKTWVKIGEHYYLKSVLNYTTDNIDSNEIKYYDMTSGNSNGKNYIDINKEFVTDNKISRFNIEQINEKCKQMKFIHEKEIISNNLNNEILFKNNKIKLSLLLNKINSDESIFLESENITEECKTFSEYYSSDSETSQADVDKVLQPCIKQITFLEV